MGILAAFFAKPTNIFVTLLVALTVLFGGTAYYFYHQNITLEEQLAVQKHDNQVYVETHNQQIKDLTSIIDTQNAAISQFKQTGDKQVQEMGKVQSKVDQMRVTAEQQLAVLRQQNVANLTCDQSTQFLIQKAKTLTWGVVQ